jgi:hypothetical protein
MTIPIHRLQNGALLIFAFFMISDPRTTPDRAAGRVLFALLVALGAAFVQFRLFRTNGLLWSLAFSPRSSRSSTGCCRPRRTAGRSHSGGLNETLARPGRAVDGRRVR